MADAFQCSDPNCRENLKDLVNKKCKELTDKIDRSSTQLHEKANKKIGARSFWTGLSASLIIIATVLGLAYNAYSGRQERIEQKQDRQAEQTQKIDKSVEVIKTKQERLAQDVREIKQMLNTILQRTTEERRRERNIERDPR